MHMIADYSLGICIQRLAFPGNTENVEINFRTSGIVPRELNTAYALRISTPIRVISFAGSFPLNLIVGT